MSPVRYPSPAPKDFAIFASNNPVSVEISLLQSFFVWKLSAAKLWIHHSPI